jgi:PAS domain S-box-containing protein
VTQHDAGAAPTESEVLRRIVDTIPATLAYWDRSQRCRFAHGAYQQWFGLSPESLIGKHASELSGALYPLDLPYIEGALRGEPQEFEREIPDPSGGPPRHSLANYIPDAVDGVVRGFFVLVSDVSTIKRAELALGESEERFRLTFEEAPIGMALVANDGRFARVNRSLCEIVGYPEDELTGLTFQAITHPDDLDADLMLAAQLSRGEIPHYKLAKRYIRKDGTLVDVMLHGSVLRGPDGAPLYYIAQIEDITEQFRAQEAIRQSQERFELALRGADLASWDWQVTTGKAVVNPRWATMRGFRPEEIEPHVDSWMSGIHPDDRLEVKHALAAYFQGRTPDYVTEHRVRTKSGEWLWVLDRGKVFARDEQGLPTRMVGTELDITQRKKVEQEQRFLAEVGPVLAGTLDYEETLSRIAELAVRDLADLCIVDIVEDDQEIRRLKVTSRDPSKAWLRDLFTGLEFDRSRPHLMGSVLETMQPFVLKHPSAETIASLAQSDEHHRALIGAEIESVLAVPLVARGSLLGAIAFLSSTPSRVYGPADVRLAEELAHRAALSIMNARLYRTARQAIRARDELLGIVAHDLRNPLHNIAMQAGLLRLRDGAGGGTRHAAEVITRAATRMNRLIQDLLDITCMEAGELSVDAVRVDAHEIVTAAAEAQEAFTTSASLELRLELATDLPEILADRDRLCQVFENLIGNAVKFTEPGGLITVGAAPREGHALFWVGDTGTGIAAEHLPHLFDRFWQARKEERHGAGLGLPIVRGIIDAHRGRIWVESTPGEGSTFYFTVPAAHGSDVEMQEPVQRGVAP